jgi:hypothetical protein
MVVRPIIARYVGRVSYKRGLEIQQQLAAAHVCRRQSDFEARSILLMGTLRHFSHHT